MGDQDFRVDVPTDDALDELFHAPDIGNPRPVDGLLIMDDIGGWLEGDCAAFAKEADFAPLAGGLNTHKTRFVIGRTVNRLFDTVSAGEGADLGDILGTRDEDIVTKFERLGQLEAFWNDIGPNDLLSAHRLGQHRSCQADRAQTRYKDRIVTADPDFFKAFVHCAKTTGYLCAIGIAKRIGKQYQIFFFSQQIICHPPIALPAIGSTVGAGAGDHVTTAAVIADAAPRNVVNDDAVAFLEAPATRAGLDDLPAGLMSGDHAALLALGTLAKVLVVDGTDIRAADRRCLGP